ncbi:nuclear transport factor 2 family protein [Chryseolinea sp. T2]|uniref:nuclear transport factor 2 family protein n=1 Tax=Chryseolinea sp. T2 TaxID=3129255 RepID=UPI00307824E1
MDFDPGIYLITVVMMIAGCREQQQVESPDTNKETALAMFDAFNKHDWQKMADYYAEGADFLDPSLGKSFVKQSHKEIVDKYQGMQQMFPDIKDEVTSVHVDGEAVIVQFTSHGTMDGGTSFSLPIITVLTFDDGLITRDATYYDLENE